MHKQTVVAFLICLVLLALIIPGCSDKHETYQNIVTTVYYDDLNKGKYVELPAAVPQFPASGELYSENTSIFRLVAASAGSLQKALPKAMLSDFTLYTPPAATSKQVALAISDTSSSTAAFSGSAIPSLGEEKGTLLIS